MGRRTGAVSHAAHALLTCSAKTSHWLSSPAGSRLNEPPGSTRSLQVPQPCWGALAGLCALSWLESAPQQRSTQVSSLLSSAAVPSSWQHACGAGATPSSVECTMACTAARAWQQQNGIHAARNATRMVWKGRFTGVLQACMRLARWASAVWEVYAEIGSSVQEVREFCALCRLTLAAATTVSGAKPKWLNTAPAGPLAPKLRMPTNWPSRPR